MNTANITRNWKTSVAAACILIAICARCWMLALQIGVAPAILATVQDESNQVAVAAAVGLLFAKDGGVSGTTAAPNPPAPEPFDKNLIGN